MHNYTNLLKNISLIILIVIILKLYNEKNELRSINQKMLKKQRQESELIVDKKLQEIGRLKEQIERDQFMIDESLNVIAELQNEKRKVEKVYVDNVKKINTFDATQLKNYFNEELK
jgi:cell division protein ZapA (FtsZ GTPase activity inhibitor)